MTPQQTEKIRSRFPPLPEEEAYAANNGWLDRDGKFYQCNWTGHADLAYDIIHACGIRCRRGQRDPQLELEARGWVKISGSFVHWIPLAARERGWKEFFKPSKEQNDFIMLYLSQPGRKDRLQQWLLEQGLEG